jgi:FKBP-type peptidyl-prolyl cis-trans isomerase (trigger factor)
MVIQKNKASQESHINSLFSDTQPKFEICFEVDQIDQTLAHATVIIPAEMVEILYHETALSQIESSHTTGFSKGKVPIEYIKINFREKLIDHLKELLFKYVVIGELYKNIRLEKLMVAGYPRLMNISLAPESDARFSFELTIYSDLPHFEWKFLPFKAPKRKNYKDLDRQVTSFIRDEKTNYDACPVGKLIMGDWVNFDLSFANNQNQPILGLFSENFWFHLGHDETEGSLREIFLGKQIGEEIYTRAQGIQEYFSDQLDTQYNFHIKITDILPHSYICMDQFKRHFRIKTNKELHKKLIEVFSYRNDISQRRAMVEAAFQLLFSKYRFDVPNHLVLRQKQVLLDVLRENPDYNVYRVQKDFRHRINQLAEKQTKESILIDRLAYQDNLNITNHDVKSYLNLTLRPRMKEFIYFDLPVFKIQGQEVPIPTEEIKRTVMREKTVNLLIHHLTKA